MTDYVETFTCPECKTPASGTGHMCHPNKDAGAATCGFCKEETSDPRHICPTMLDSIEYVCKKCGRLAVYDTLLCEPVLIAGD